MTTSFLTLTALLWAASFGWAGPVDLSKIDRAIAKEPTYQTRSPKHCLLVYTSQATTRIWLVLDGDALYVDRNGNGDLTEEGKKVTFVRQRGPDTVSRIEAGRITAKGVPENTWVRLALGDEATSITSSSTGGLYQCAGDDFRGGLQFGDKPQTAPIVHFYGRSSSSPRDGRHWREPVSPCSSGPTLAHRVLARVRSPGLAMKRFRKMSTR
jgi:hypothetical protein